MIDINNEIDRATVYFKKEARRRNAPAISRLSIIMDNGGGWRFVITPRYDIKNHLTKGERAIVVPRVRIAEPVELDDLPRTIKLAERYAATKLSKGNPCGNCKACCITPRIHDEKLNKPAHTACPYLDSCVNGCGIYPARPRTCKSYECEWLKSQRVNDRMPLELRPDKCGVIFQTATAANNYDPDVIEAHPDVGWSTNPFEAENVKQHIDALLKYGKKVISITHYVSDE